MTTIGDYVTALDTANGEIWTALDALRQKVIALRILENQISEESKEDQQVIAADVAVRTESRDYHGLIMQMGDVVVQKNYGRPSFTDHDITDWENQYLDPDNYPLPE